MPGAGTVSQSRAEMDQLIADLVGENRKPVVVLHASTMTVEERQRYGFPEDWTPRQPGPKNACSIAGCDRPKLAKGLCRRHYERKRAHEAKS